jgi:hypothetical protein
MPKPLTDHLTEDQLADGWTGYTSESPRASPDVIGYFRETDDLNYTLGIFHIRGHGFYVIPHGDWSGITAKNAVAGPFEDVTGAAGARRLLNPEALQ